MLGLGCRPKYGKAVENNRDVGGNVLVGRIVSGDPCLTFGGFNLEVEGGEGGDPKGPDCVEERGVAGEHDVVNISENGDKLCGVSGVALRELGEFEASIESVDDFPKEDAEDGSGKTFTLEDALGDLYLLVGGRRVGDEKRGRVGAPK